MSTPVIEPIAVPADVQAPASFTELVRTALTGQSEDLRPDLNDRCDQCGPASAAAAVFGYASGELMLCAHHTRQHLPAILASRMLSWWIDPEALWHLDLEEPAAT
ncbi:hypothetical protein V6N00_13615 [Tersicoccus sp. MR15.9]|uniref:DUF7455 domain-containing protein n=1 Tax=Tersicoccus mangrovi TaxID=3121635 RepID=UPI002FE5B839